MNPKYKLHTFSSSRNNEAQLQAIYDLNQANTPEVGSLESMQHLKQLIEFSSYNLLVLKEDEIVATSLNKVYGDVISVPGLMIAASDTRHYSKIADNSFRFNPFSIVPEDMTGFHGTNESIGVDSFISGIKTYVEIISEGSSS